MEHRRQLMGLSCNVQLMANRPTWSQFSLNRRVMVNFGLLAFTAGISLTIALEEIIPEAHREDEARLAAVSIVGGFALFTLIAIYLG